MQVVNSIREYLAKNVPNCFLVPNTVVNQRIAKEFNNTENTLRHGKTGKALLLAATWSEVASCFVHW